MDNGFYDSNDSQISNADASFHEDDDTEYDAHNSETFGDNIQSSDWEEAHEKLASQLKKCSFEEQNLELSKRVASFILDDEVDDTLKDTQACGPRICSTPIPDSSKSNLSALWYNGQDQKNVDTMKNWIAWATGSMPLTPSEDQHQTQDQHTHHRQSQLLPQNPPKIKTVEEIEKQMRMEAESKGAVKRTSPCLKDNPDTERDLDTQGPRGHFTNEHFSGRRTKRIFPSPNRVKHPPIEINQNQYYGMQQPYFSYGENRPVEHRPLPHLLERQQPSGHPQLPVKPGRMYPIRVPENYTIPPGPQRGFKDHPMRPENLYHQNLQQPPPHPSPQLTPPQPPVDEYSGLMTHQEKQWLVSIQMMQLNTSQPYHDDFYHLMNQQRGQGNSHRKPGPHNLKSNWELPGARPTSAYTPLQFENSLGKLQIGSVTAPRKIIDTDLVENLENSSSKLVEKKSKQLLIEIEQMYNLVLEIEEACYPFIARDTNLNTSIIRSAENKILLMLMTGNKLVSVMSIRKGKKLVLRVIPLLFNRDLLIHRLLLDLAPIAKKDADQFLLSFLPSIRTYIAEAPLSKIVEITKKYEVTFLLSSKLVISVVANLIERAATKAYAECKDDDVLQEWILFLIRLIMATTHWKQTERPVVAIERTLLIDHLTLIQENVQEDQLNNLILTLSMPWPSTDKSELMSLN